jgi:hypothetical protein
VRWLFFVILLAACTKAHNPIATPIEQSLFDSIKSDCKAVNASLSSDRKTIHLSGIQANFKDLNRQSTCLFQALENKKVRANLVVMIGPNRPASVTKVETPASSCIQKFETESKARQWQSIKLFNVGSSVKDLRLVPERTAKYETVLSAVEFLQKHCIGVSLGFVGNEAASQ